VVSNDRGSARAELSYKTRRENLDRMKTMDFDIVVIGGGVTGAGIARDAAMRGLKVALLEKDDFGSGTSGKSSRLIHAGLRYLRYRKLRLVYELSTERSILGKIAPHTVQPLAFVIPVYEKGPDSMLKIRFGLLLYDILARFRNFRRHRMVDPREVWEIEPEIKSEGLRGAGIYYDSQADDTALTMLTIVSAARQGATVANYVEVMDFLKEKAKAVGVRVRDSVSKQEFKVRGKILINAAGPWSDKIRRIEDPDCQKRCRLTKGIHLMVMRDKIRNNNALVVNVLQDQRNIFVLPWGSRCLIGTTDTDFEGDPDDVYAEKEDVNYLLETVKEHAPGSKLTPEDVISTWAGLRALMDTEGVTESEASREYEIMESSSGLITVAGGKLTAHRSMAKKAVDRAVTRLEKEHNIHPRKECLTDRVSLEGGDIEDINMYLVEEMQRAQKELGLDEEVITHLIRRYGSNHRKLQDLVKQSPELGRRIVEDLPYIWAELPYATEHEMAMTLSDFLVRRTHIAYEDWNQGISVSRTVAEAMAKHLGWNLQEVSEQIRIYQKGIDRSRSFRRGG